MSFTTIPLWSLVDPIIDRALAEDLAGGDLTSEACVLPEAEATAKFVTRHAIVTAGIPIAKRVIERVNMGPLTVRGETPDGTFLEPGSHLLEVHGNARSLLMAERVALNVLQRLCGIATQTRAYVQSIASGTSTRIADTRKTTPGLRVLERYAVRCGGGHNHRDMLGSAVLIKDNHLVAAGGVRAAILRARQYAPHTSRIECEVETFPQLEEALEVKADVILLDNMNDLQVKEALGKIRLFQDATGHRVITEVSGGITLERIHTLSLLGVDVISVGALTHSVKAADIALDLSLL